MKLKKNDWRIVFLVVERMVEVVDEMCVVVMDKDYVVHNDGVKKVAFLAYFLLYSFHNDWCVIVY